MRDSRTSWLAVARSVVAVLGAALVSAPAPDPGGILMQATLAGDQVMTYSVELPTE